VDAQVVCGFQTSGGGQVSEKSDMGTRAVSG